MERLQRDAERFREVNGNENDFIEAMRNVGSVGMDLDEIMLMEAMRRSVLETDSNQASTSISVTDAVGDETSGGTPLPTSPEEGTGAFKEQVPET